MPRGFASTYWPEPRLGRRETRTEVVRRLHGKAKPTRVRMSVADALRALASRAERK